MKFDVRVRRANVNNFADGDVIRSVNNAFAYTIHDARISTSAGVEIEQNKYVGPISTIMELVTQKDGEYIHVLILLMKVRPESIIHH